MGDSTYLTISDLTANWTAVRTASLAGGTSTAFAYRKIGDKVEFAGKLSGFAGAIFTLPVGYRPNQAVTVNCYNGYIDITTAGVMTTSATTAMLLDGSGFTTSNPT